MVENHCKMDVRPSDHIQNLRVCPPRSAASPSDTVTTTHV